MALTEGILLHYRRFVIARNALRIIVGGRVVSGNEYEIVFLIFRTYEIRLLCREKPCQIFENLTGLRQKTGYIS